MNYKQSATEIAAELGSDVLKGLTIEKAHERIHSRGRNEIRVPKVKKTFAAVWKNMLSIMNVLLLLMAVMHFADDGLNGLALSLCFIVCAVVNAAVGYINFGRSSSVAGAAESAQNQNVRVIRSGSEKEVGAVLLTQGDVILLEKGQTVPADAKIIDCSSLVVDESIINGDGSSVTKSPRYGIEDEGVTMLYMGTKILEGTAKAIVTDVGGRTQLGSAAGMLENEPAKASAFAKRISVIGNICGAAAALMWAAALIIRLLGGFGLVSALDNSISAAITAIPVSLSAVLLITMSIDIFRLRKHGVDIGSISAVEAMGASTVLCVGKRGVITEPGFTVSEVSSGKGFDENSLRLLAAMCTTADISGDKPRGDAMQVALIEDAAAHGQRAEDIRNKAPLEKVLDDRSSKRIMATVHKTSSGYTVICKGSADAVLSCCSYIYDNGTRLLDPQTDIAAVVGESQAMAEKALTVIGVAFKDVPDLEGDLERGLTFVGLIGLRNQIRKDTAAALKSLNTMGVKTCIITNDNLTSAASVAEECGIGRDNVIQSASVQPDSLSRIRKSTVFADTPPSMKAEIIAAINSGRESVACVGRSAKDINAMGRAEVSISTDAGAKVCSAAADVCISGSGLGRIADAVRECKRTFINNDRLIGFLLSCNVAEMLCAIVSLIMGYSIPFTPLGVMWLNIIVATAGAVAIWREPYHKPFISHGRKELRHMKKGSLARSTIMGALLRGLLMGASAMAVYAAMERRVVIGERRTAVFLILCTAFVFMAQNCRSDELIIKRIKENKAAYICFAVGAAATVIAVKSELITDLLGINAYIQPGTVAVGIIAGIVSVAIAELYKLAAGRRAGKGHTHER